MLNVALVGLGRWGQTILASVQGRSERICIVHGVSKEPQPAAALAERYRFRLSSDLEDAIGDPDVQAVLLATPHSLHVEQVCMVAAAGKPIWCEKPLALTKAEAARAIAAAEAAGLPLATGNNKRCFASMRELAKLVAAGELGEIMHIEGHFSNEHSTRVSGGWRDDPAESPGGGMTGAGLHLIDAFVNLAGPFRSVHARCVSKKAPPNPRDAVAGLVEFKSNATGLFATVRATPMFWRVHVFGTLGSAEARGEDDLIVAKIGASTKHHSFEHVDSVRVLLECFADAAESKASFPVTTDQILDAIGAFEAVLASMDEHRPVTIA
jgi:predicted dehydrogenase